jgi:hypothetical protein
MTIFIRGKQKRVRRPLTIEGMDVEEFIRLNADPIWLHQNELWEYMELPEEPVQERGDRFVSRRIGVARQQEGTSCTASHQRGHVEASSGQEELPASRPPQESGQP